MNNELQAVIKSEIELAAKMQAVHDANGHCPEYVMLQRKMQKLLKQERALDPRGEAPYNHQVWLHSAKPFRQSRLVGV